MAVHKLQNLCLPIKQKSRQRLAFTLVELLVVIAIIGILVGLLLPAVQAARESARRLQCKNNFKQLGLAFQNHHDSKRSFPVNMTASGPKLPTGKWGTGLYSWFVPLLPYLEEEPLYRSIDHKINMADVGDAPYNPRISAAHPNAAASAKIVSAFLCPSDTYEITALMGTAEPAPANYMANVGWPPYSTGIDGTRATPARQNGFVGLVHPSQNVSWHTGATKVRHFTDGLSHTMACTERLITQVTKAADLEDEDGNLAIDPRMASLCAGSGGTKRTLDGYYQYTKNSHTDLTQTKLTGRSWISGSALVGNTCMPVMPINTFNAHFDDAEDGRTMFTPSSKHPGGVHVLMGDGSVHFIDETIDMPVYWSMSSRDGGETIPNNSF